MVADQENTMTIDLATTFPIRVLTPARDMQKWKDRGITAVEGPPKGELVAQWMSEAIRLKLSIWLRGAHNVSVGGVVADARCGPDEPDLLRKQMTVADLAERMKLMARPRFLNFSGDLLQQSESNYRAMMMHAEIVSGDIYPVNQANKGRPLSAQVEMVGKLRAWSGEKPCGAYIECAQFDTAVSRAPTPAEMRAQTWLAILGGARTLGYFPHQIAPTFKFDATPPDLVEEMTRVNAEIRDRAHILQGPIDPVDLFSVNRNIHVGTRVHEGALYLISVNASAIPQVAEIFDTNGTFVYRHAYASHQVRWTTLFSGSEWLKTNTGAIIDAALEKPWGRPETIRARVLRALGGESRNTPGDWHFPHEPD